ncbi:hypothetical protein [Streptomyces sp. NPDC006971]|uniref:hypothetical protein n=1 Tax=Streptomyces sp. NPDC006971 TaxID=3154784 RepID=UPI0033CF44E8
MTVSAADMLDGRAAPDRAYLAVAAEIIPDNTVDTYNKSWRVWERFCAAQGLPEREGSRGALVAFVTWMPREGQQTGRGYAPSSVSPPPGGRRPRAAPAWRDAGSSHRW